MLSHESTDTGRRPPKRIVTTANQMSRSVWADAVKGSDGACIPIAYTLDKAYELMGYRSMIVETKVRVHAFGDVRTAMTTEGRDGFWGHLVVYLPTLNWMIDASLHTQDSQVIRSAMPDSGAVFLDFNHNHHTTSEVSLDRGVAEYTEFRFNDNTWRGFDWPWTQLDMVALVLSGIDVIGEEE